MEGERTNPDMNTYSAVIIKTLINVERQHVLNSSCQTTEKYVLLRITMDEYVSTKLHHSRPNAYGTLKLTLCMFGKLPRKPDLDCSLVRGNMETTHVI